jgi:hypothetical protein
VIGPFHIGIRDVMLALAVAEFVIGPLSTLAHELGHARMALRASPGRVIVVVGRHSAGLKIIFERLQISLSPVPAQGVGFHGICIWDSRRATPRERLRVSIAGPIVTAALIPAYAFLAVLTADAPAWIEATFVLSASSCVVSCLFNLDPRPANAAERAAPSKSRRDGPRALNAYRAMRQDDREREWMTQLNRRR